MKVVVHESPLVGTWYPGDTIELRALLDEAFERSRQRTGAFVRPGGIGFVVPHAAPMYSGTVAAAVYRHIRQSNASRVVVLGFSHRRQNQGIAIPQVDEFETPLGEVMVDRAAAAELAGAPPFQSVPERVVCDHSVEIQLLFLRHILPDATVVPLYVGPMSEKQRAEAARRLLGLVDSRTVLVASSDLTHYGQSFGYVPFPVDEDTPDKLKTLDERVLDCAGSLDAALFRTELERTGATFCGYEPISLLLTLLSLRPGEEMFQETLDYQTSGDITDDYAHSVSYGALGYFPADAYHLDAPSQKALLASARNALDGYLRTGELRMPMPDAGSALAQRSRAFVSVYSDGELRGCVGRFERPETLARVVPELAITAARDDPRFQPIGAEEPFELDIHLLTPKKRIREATQMIENEHGAWLEAGPFRALLLPVVWRKYGWGRAEFLKALAHKAGVGESVYANSRTRLFVFRGQVITEHASTAE